MDPADQGVDLVERTAARRGVRRREDRIRDARVQGAGPEEDLRPLPIQGARTGGRSGRETLPDALRTLDGPDHRALPQTSRPLLADLGGRVTGHSQRRSRPESGRLLVMTIQSVGDLEPGDVLLFTKPKLVDVLDAIKDDRKHKDTDPDVITFGILLNDLISALDGCPYTHVAVVLDQPHVPDDRVIAGSDYLGLVQTTLKDIRYEYGGGPIAVLRLRDRADRPTVAGFAERLSVGRTKTPYPHRTMFAGFCLLGSATDRCSSALADGPQNEILNRAQRYAADRYAGEALGRWYAAVQANPRTPALPAMTALSPFAQLYLPTCSAFVADVLLLAGVELTPQARSTAPQTLANGDRTWCYDPVTMAESDVTLVAVGSRHAAP